MSERERLPTEQVRAKLKPVEIIGRQERELADLRAKLHAAEQERDEQAELHRTWHNRYDAEVPQLRALLARYREALERIALEDTHPDDCGAIACEALSIECPAGGPHTLFRDLPADQEGKDG